MGAVQDVQGQEPLPGKRRDLGGSGCPIQPHGLCPHWGGLGWAEEVALAKAMPGGASLVVLPRCQTHLHAQVKSSEEEKEEIPSPPVQQAPFGAGGMQGSVSVGHLCTVTLGLPGVKGHQKWSHLALFFLSSSWPCETKH